MSKVYLFKVFCQTEGVYVERWDTVKPSVCPNNNTHTINQSSWTVIKTIDQNTVEIKEERVSTGSNFIFESHCFDVPASVGTHIFNISWPFNISILNGILFMTNENKGDKLSVIGAPDTTIGTIIANASTGETTLTVNSTVTDYIMVGYFANITDGGNTDELGRVLSVDKANSQITVENALVNNFSAGLCSIRMNVYRLKDFVFAVEGKVDIGRNKIGASSLPANAGMRFVYENNDGAAKQIHSSVEYLY